MFLLYFSNLHYFLNFFEKSDPHSLCISKITAAKEVVKQMSRKPRFRTPFNSQHVKGSRRIVKFA